MNYTINFAAAGGETARIANIRAALARKLPEVEMVPVHDRTMVVCGYGPTLTDQLWMVRCETGDVFTTSGAHDVLIEAGIVPRGHIDCDPRSHKALLIGKPNRNVDYLIASCCPAEMFEKLAGQEVYLWHSAQSESEDKTVAEIAGDKPMVLGWTTVVSRAMCLGSMMGYRRFRLYGVPCSFDETQHAGAHPNEAANHELMTVRVAGEVFRTSAQLMRAAQDFCEQVAQMKDCTFEMADGGLLPHAMKAMKLPRVTVLADKERMAA